MVGIEVVFTATRWLSNNPAPVNVFAVEIGQEDVRVVGDFSWGYLEWLRAGLESTFPGVVNSGPGGSGASSTKEILNSLPNSTSFLNP